MVRGYQLYKCHACGKHFLGGNRIDAATLCREYTDLKQTYAQLAERYGCSPRTIKRKLDSYTPPQGVATYKSCRGDGYDLLGAQVWGNAFQGCNHLERLAVVLRKERDERFVRARHSGT